MVTILLEKILSVLEGWSASFASFIIDLMTKLDLIEDETANLPDIKTNTDNISSNTDSMTATLTNIKTDTGSISGKVNSIDSNTTIIKNNINTISTNVGTASAFCEDTANNTLEIVDKITTIASDTTQLRTNSNTITSDVHDIKDSLQYYFLTNIVTEDSEGSIANFDTDLKDYLQNAVVTIPAIAGGISEINITRCGVNICDCEWEIGRYDTNTGAKIVNNVSIRNKNLIPIKPNTTYYKKSPNPGFYWHIYYDIDKNYLSRAGVQYNATFTTPVNAYFMATYSESGYGTTYNNDFSINYIDSYHNLFEYEGNTYTITFGTPITDGAEVDLLSGMVKINTTPVTYDSITPIVIRTFKGVNNVYSDIGDISVTYRETLKHYLDKQNS